MAAARSFSFLPFLPFITSLNPQTLNLQKKGIKRTAANAVPSLAPPVCIVQQALQRATPMNRPPLPPVGQNAQSPPMGCPPGQVAQLLLRPHLDHLARVAAAVARLEAVVTRDIPAGPRCVQLATRRGVRGCNGVSCTCQPWVLCEPAPVQGWARYRASTLHACWVCARRVRTARVHAGVHCMRACATGCTLHARVRAPVPVLEHQDGGLVHFDGQVRVVLAARGMIHVGLLACGGRAGGAAVGLGWASRQRGGSRLIHHMQPIITFPSVPKFRLIPLILID